MAAIRDLEGISSAAWRIAVAARGLLDLDEMRPAAPRAEHHAGARAAVLGEDLPHQHPLRAVVDAVAPPLVAAAAVAHLPRVVAEVRPPVGPRRAAEAHRSVGEARRGAVAAHLQLAVRLQLAGHVEAREAHAGRAEERRIVVVHAGAEPLEAGAGVAHAARRTPPSGNLGSGSPSKRRRPSRRARRRRPRRRAATRRPSSRRSPRRWPRW